MKKFRETAGFTLVELIVVIAIMGILAGIGTAGYGGYVQHANKGADKQLVGNIVRAIETGTNSTMFVSDNSMELGSMTYPVGVINLTHNNAGEIKATGSTQEVTGNTDCHMVTENFYTVTSKTNTYYIQEQSWGKWGSSKATSQSYYELTPTPVTYCDTHTNLPEKKTYKQQGTPHTNGYEYTNFFTRTKVVGGTYYELIDSTAVYNIADCTGIFALATAEKGHADGKHFDSVEFNKGSLASVGEGNALYDSLKAAFGNPADLKLSWDGWGKEVQHTYSTLLANSDSLMNGVRQTMEDLESLDFLADLVGAGYFSDDFQNSADMMTSFADYLVGKHTSEAAWDIVWANAATSTTRIDYTYGLDEPGKYHHDYIYAATKAFNNGFATYCAANGIEEPYLSIIENFATSANESTATALITQDKIPRTVNAAAFAGVTAGYGSYASSLQDKFNAKGDDGTEFEKCKKLFDEYKNSDICKENGKSFYTMMDTVAQTAADAYLSGEGGSDAYFNYYENYLQEISAFYNSIDDNAGNGIMIIVTVKDGDVVCDVSPAEADPRTAE